MDSPAAPRGDYPVLDREVNGRPLVYLDNAATTQTPAQVREAHDEFYRRYNANVHRGIHTLSHEASMAYERAHDRVAAFVGAAGREEIVFTKNTTEAINIVAHSLGEAVLDEDATIVTTEMEHHASLVTWQQIAERTGATIEFVRVTDDGRLDMDHAKTLVDDSTALLSVVHVSNVLGTVNPVAELAALAHDHDAYVLVDGAQSVPNRPVDVSALDADFLAFSGHKMAGPTGIGVLYGKAHLLKELPPFLFGGEMIRNVTLSESSWNELPWKFEAGTPPIAEGIALAAAVDYLEEIGMDRIRAHENELAQYALERLEARPDVETYGPPPGAARAGLVSFNVGDVHGHDLSSVLNDRGIAVRAGDHCTQPLHDVLDVPGSVRASFYVYNTAREIDRLLDAIENAEPKRDAHVRDNYHDRIVDHFERPRDDGVPGSPSFVVAADETSCGDDGEFAVSVDAAGRIDGIGYKSESCAVSTAVASLLSEYLQGRRVDDVETLKAEVTDLLDAEFPELRRDCVVGPVEVIQHGVAEYLAESAVPNA